MDGLRAPRPAMDSLLALAGASASPPSTALPPAFEAWILGVAWTAPFLLLAAGFAVLRAALLHTHEGRLLARLESGGSRDRLARALRRVESLATSAGIFEVLCELAFALILLRHLAGAGPVDARSLLLTLAIAGPLVVTVSQALPTVLALRIGDRLLLAILPAFHVMQMPLAWLVRAIEALSRVMMRVVGLRSDPAYSRRIVEGLRNVIEDSEISGDLDASEREMIGNVIDFRDVAVSAVMTPRTEVHAIGIDEGLRAAADEMAACGHSRIPVYQGSLDRVVGVITARDVLLQTGKGGPDGPLRAILRPAHFVPETKRVTELLAEFRREKVKLAIVLDEYGGTAGLVTLGDIVEEIVGEIRDEFDEEAPPRFKPLQDGRIEVDAGLRVSEVNAELRTDIPEDEDYETLAGYVLAELGHFPRRGEGFTAHGARYTVVEASDRRVIRVAILAAPQEAGV